MENIISVIGAGLAGCEAAWQIAKHGGKVRLYEMKPNKKTPAHHLDSFAELVCSNSLRSNQIENAVGLLKEELRRMGSLIMQCADENAVPAGGALAVDREEFSKCVTDKIKENKNIEVVYEEVMQIDESEMTIIATGPLTSDPLAQRIAEITGIESLSFFDAASPIVVTETIDFIKVFSASRYNKGTGDYLNCPMNKEEYLTFYNELINAEVAEVKDFEKNMVFEGCMPVEVMAGKGIDTLRFGPLKPVGLINHVTGTEPYAVVQLRKDNKAGTLYNLVGFQTHLKWGEQKRVFSLIPGLEKAEFIRYGVMHRNTFINSPKLISPTYRFKEVKNLYFAGQITGVEGYVESTASGLVAGLNAIRELKGLGELVFPSSTAIGALAHYVSSYSGGAFQPMNINFGIIDGLSQESNDMSSNVNKKFFKKDKHLKNRMIAERSLNIIDSLKDK